MHFNVKPLKDKSLVLSLRWIQHTVQVNTMNRTVWKVVPIEAINRRSRTGGFWVCFEYDTFVLMCFRWFSSFLSRYWCCFFPNWKQIRWNLRTTDTGILYYFGSHRCSWNPVKMNKSTNILYGLFAVLNSFSRHIQTCFCFIWMPKQPSIDLNTHKYFLFKILFLYCT